MNYKIILDAGCPYEVSATDENIYDVLAEFYEKNIDNSPYMDCVVYNDQGVDISESQFITEIIEEIVNPSYNDG